MVRIPRSRSLRRPSAATTSSKGSMTDTSSGSLRRREAMLDSARRRRSREKSERASSLGSPVLLMINLVDLVGSAQDPPAGYAGRDRRPRACA
jgi:hypothetical protein